MHASASNAQIPVLYTANALHGHISYKYLVASNENSLCLSHQHGGGYGLCHVNIPERYERNVSDKFYTWGWRENNRTKPLPVPPRLLPKKSGERYGILLKCVNYPRYVYKIVNAEMGVQNLNLIEETIRFVKKVKHLDIDIAHYPLDYGWKVKERFASADASLPNQSRREIDYALHTCNYLGTSWLETLAANMPTICFYNPNVYRFREVAKPFIESLEEVGILHKSPESASQKVVEASYNLQNWWQTDEVQGARLDFVQNYARLEDGWEIAWQEEFTNLVDNI